MTSRERFHKLMAFEPVDRLPVLEWAPWWTATLERWRGEGLPADLDTNRAVRDYFGQDPIEQWWAKPRYPEMVRGQGCIRSRADYERLRETIFDVEALDWEGLRRIAAARQRDGGIFWITLDGFFWTPRELFGIEPHMYAFFDEPDLMHAMNEDLIAYDLRILERVAEICPPDFMTFAEDMSYNHGPMLSRETFDTFLAPYYRRVIPRVKEMGAYVFMDSDGLINDLVPWCQGVGVDGFLPLEHQAGVDIAALRRRHPRLLLLGAYDKMVMNQGEQAMRREFERILPVMRQGGYLPSVDHQTPPGVSLANYRIFMKLFNEYCRAAAG